MASPCRCSGRSHWARSSAQDPAGAAIVGCGRAATWLSRHAARAVLYAWCTASTLAATPLNCHWLAKRAGAGRDLCYWLQPLVLGLPLNLWNLPVPACPADPGLLQRGGRGSAPQQPARLRLLAGRHAGGPALTLSRAPSHCEPHLRCNRRGLQCARLCTCCGCCACHPCCISSTSGRSRTL